MEKKIDESFENKISNLAPVYQEEFRKMYYSNGEYKGTWNWWAFLFGGLWLIYKKCYMMGIIVIALSVATAGFFLLVLWGIVGFRGNHMYYQNYVHGDMLSL